MTNFHVTIKKVNQNNKLFKKAYKKKGQQSHVLVIRATQQNQELPTKAKTSMKNTDIKSTKARKNPFAKQTTESGKITNHSASYFCKSHG